LIRTRDTGEIYLLSLDTFMIMAVMGLTLGTIFFIVNPNLSLALNPESARIEVYISNDDFVNLTSFSRSDNSVRILNAQTNHYRYTSSEGWRVTYRCRKDERLDRWSLIVSARNSLRETVIGDEEIMNYLIRIRTLREMINY